MLNGDRGGVARASNDSREVCIQGLVERFGSLAGGAPCSTFSQSQPYVCFLTCSSFMLLLLAQKSLATCSISLRRASRSARIG